MPTGGSTLDAVLAVDVGGTKLEAAVVDRAGHIHHRARRATPGAAEAPRAAGPPGAADVSGADEVLFAALVDVAAEAADGAPGGRVVGCGVGCGGPMAPGGAAVSPLNIPAWRGFPLRDRLAGALGVPVWVDNDAKALALGEGWRGAARHARSYLAMVVSTGVGGGLVVDGRLLDGEGGNAGHVGHVIVEPEGRRCGCGARGCLEAEASGTAIARATGRPAQEATPEVVARTGRLVGRGVASVVSLLDLHLTVVAGSVALGFGAPFFAAARAELGARARLSFAAGARIERAGLGDVGPLVGAAAVGWRGLEGAPPRQHDTDRHPGPPR